MLDQLTLIIPTYRRQVFLPRLLSFYKDFPIRLIIVDGTDDSPSFDSLTSISSPFVTYLYLPGVSFRDRILLASNLLSTPYVAWLGDDEFHLPTGLSRSISILQDSPKIASAIGLSAGFNVQKGEIVWGDHYRYKPLIISGSIPSRIEMLFSHYSPTIAYSVWRTSIYKTTLDACFHRDWGSGALFEFMHALCCVCAGGHVVHDQLQWLRSGENPPVEAHSNRKISILEWYDDSRFNTEKKDFYSVMIASIKSIVGCNKQYASRLIDLAFASSRYCNDNRILLANLGLIANKNFNRNFHDSLHDYFVGDWVRSVDFLELDSVYNSIISTYY